MLSRPKWWITTFFAIGALILGGIKVLSNLSTDVLALLPQEEKPHELEFLDSLSRENVFSGLETVIRPRRGFIPAAAAHQAVGNDFLKRLEGNSSIASAYAIDNFEVYRPLMDTLLKERFFLLFPSWLQQGRASWEGEGRADSFEDFLARGVVTKMDEFLDSLDAIAFEESLPEDPLMLVTDMVQMLQRSGRPGAANNALIWIESVHSPFVYEGQEPVLSAVDAAFTETQIRHPQWEIVYSGAARFAQANRTGIQGEVTRLNTIGILAVGLIAVFLVRPTLAVIAVAPLIFIAVASGLWMSLLVFGQVHAITLVIGSILSGVVVDYGFHLVLSTKVERKAVTLPLVLSALSTAVGFLILAFAPLPLLRQMGVFVAAGVTGAILVGLFLFRGSETHGERPSWAYRRLEIPARWSRFLVIGALAIGAIILIVKPVTFHDDIQSFNFHAQKLVDDSLETRTAFGRTQGTHIIFARGPNALVAIESAKSLLGSSSTGNFTNWAHLLSSGSELDAVATHLDFTAFEESLRSAMLEAEFEVEAFAPFFTQLRAFAALDNEVRRTGAEQAYQKLSKSMPPHLRMLFHSSDHEAWIAQEMPPGFAVPEFSPVLFSLDQVRGLNRVLAEYRDWVVKMSLIALIGIAIIVPCFIKLRDAISVLVSCLISVGLSIALQDSLYGNIEIMGLIGLLLGFCLCLDYALFSQHAARTSNSRFPFSIIVSGTTTAASFAVLSMSSVPAVSSLGKSVFFTVLIALVVVFLNFQEKRARI